MDFIILKVNGTDVSSFPHEDAVRAFLTAKEPIVVEVKRRHVDDNAGQSPKLVSTGVQTELSGFAWIDDNALDCFEQDIDLEEITLRKCSSDEKLGLTVCYSSSSEADTFTEVYIRDIAPQSVAEKDGRLRQGDQILMVNGKDVANKEDTELLFAENSKAVTLLISRCLNRSEEYLTTDQEPYQNNAVEDVDENEHLTNSLIRSKLDSINHEILELDQRMQSIQLLKKKRDPPPIPLESDTEHIYETIPESGDSEPIYSCPYEPNVIQQWLESQGERWRECSKSRSKSSKSNSSAEEQENSSSAYNTGGSCNSNPLTFELTRSQDNKCKDVYRSTLVLCASTEHNAKEDSAENCETCNQQLPVKVKKGKPNVTSPQSQVTRPVFTAEQLKDTMYTNVANLQQTMILQQQLFRQALGEVTPKPTSSFTTPNFSQYQDNCAQLDACTLDTRMEWKVKRRSDGTRYIARRPVRNRILKNRALQISEERAGLTTEDDTISELKIGRYWTKEERRKHLEKSKERKQRQEILTASRSLDVDVCLQRKKSASNAENAVKRHKQKKQHKEVYDNFAVQEVLINGPKVVNANNKTIGLLSVTTV